VTEDVARLEVRAEHAVQVQVRTADRCGGDLNYRVGRFLDAGIGYVRDRHVFVPLPGESFDDDSSDAASAAGSADTPSLPGPKIG
jgi:hypothetical protein